MDNYCGDVDILWVCVQVGRPPIAGWRWRCEEGFIIITDTTIDRRKREEEV